MRAEVMLIDPQKQARTFNVDGEQLHTLFNLLNILVAEGNTLISALLFVENSTFDLPIESFDGDLPTDQFADLEKELHAVVGRSYPSETAYKRALLEVTNKQIAFFDKQIAHIRPLIDSVDMLLKQLQQMKMSVQSRQAIETSYRDTLRLYRTQLKRSLKTRGELLNLVYQLT